MDVCLRAYAFLILPAKQKIIFVHRWNLFHIFVILILSGCPCYFDLDPFIGCSLSTFTFPTSSWNHLWSYIWCCFCRVIFFSGLLMNLLYTFILIYFMKIKRSLGCTDIRILYAAKTICMQNTNAIKWSKLHVLGF